MASLTRWTSFFGMVFLELIGEPERTGNENENDNDDDKETNGLGLGVLGGLKLTGFERH